MSVTLLHKYSSTAGRVPTTLTLQPREIGINTADGILYVQTSANVIKAINPSFGIQPQSVSLDMGQTPVQAQSFTVTVNGAAVGQNVICSLGGVFPNGAFPDEIEMEPMVVVGQVTAANTIMFTLTCIDVFLNTVGRKTVNFYLG